MAEQIQKNQKAVNATDNPVKKADVERYLTDMKELSGGIDEEANKNDTPKDAQPRAGVKKEEVFTAGQPKATTSSETSQEVSEELLGNHAAFAPKDIILAVINIISVILIIILLVKLPQKAKEVKALRTENIKNESSVSFEFSDIEEAKKRSQELERLFLDESGLVEFVKEIEKIKAGGGTVVQLNFGSQQPIRDKTGYAGIPVIIEMEGSWQAIGQDLQKIQSLPYLFRAVKIEAGSKSAIGEEVQATDIIEFKYGGFLYVDDKLAED